MAKLPEWLNCGVTTIYPPGRKTGVAPGETFKGALPPRLEAAWVKAGNIKPAPKKPASTESDS